MVNSLQKLHNIEFKIISGEVAIVNIETRRNGKKKKLPDIMKDFDDTDIFNADKNDLCFKALPNKLI